MLLHGLHFKVLNYFKIFSEEAYMSINQCQSSRQSCPKGQ